MAQRIRRDELYMSISILTSRRATCRRASVGAVLVKDGRIIATGYNGQVPGEHHCNDGDCDLTQSCTRVLHAEDNLIAHCAAHGLSTIGCVMYVTLSPCPACARRIIQAGIREVVYLEKFRDDAGIKLLDRHIDVRQYETELPYLSELSKGKI